jgi:hypothetical protein
VGRRPFPEIKSDLLKLQSSMRASSSNRSREQDEMLGLTGAGYVYISLNRAEGFRMGMIRGDGFWTGRDRHKFFRKSPAFFDNRTFPPLMLCVSLESHGRMTLGQIWTEPDVNTAAKIIQLVIARSNLAAESARAASALIEA